MMNNAYDLTETKTKNPRHKGKHFDIWSDAGCVGAVSYCQWSSDWLVVLLDPKGANIKAHVPTLAAAKAMLANA